MSTTLDAQNCQKDEYPPAAFWWDRDEDDVLIRLLPGLQNGGAGNSLFGNQAFICGYDNKNGLSPRSTRNLRSDREVVNANRRTIIETMDLTITLSTLELGFLGTAAYPDYGIVQNPCWPSTVVNDPGFALLTDNPQYGASTHLYEDDPPVAATQGKYRAGYQKRDADILSQYGRAASGSGIPASAKPFRPDSILLDDGNSTRRATEGDLAEHFNLRRCTTPDCRDEIAQHDVEAVLLDPSFAIPGAGDATSSFTATADAGARDTGSIVTAVEETIAVPTPAAVGEGAARLTPSLPAPTRK
ncbi:hypothetical protein LTR86_007481 [Recurvomyces mirabilis]|nr:hypothetical protein LTR86_007481 [Recurvomyces mirabilis]